MPDDIFRTRVTRVYQLPEGEALPSGNLFGSFFPTKFAQQVHSAHGLFGRRDVFVARWRRYEVRGQLLQGNIDGNVTDTSQAAIPGATVRATNKESNFARETQTGANGEYTLTTLPPGTYTVTVTSNGFQTFNLTGVTVAAETISRVDVALTLGQVKESVTVEATAATLQIDRADVRSELSTTVLANMPVPMGRNYQNLLGTLPGVSPPQTAHSFASNSSRALTFSVNGGSINNNDIRVDGAMNWNVAPTDNALYVPALEAIESVSLASNSFDAEQSAGGGAVNLTVKSGTNAFHGTLYEDHIDQHLMAYPWTADRTKPNPLYLNNQFGGTVAGPIKKDKLFYFISSDSVRYVQTTPVVAEVPTAAMKIGDLSASPTPIYNPLKGNATHWQDSVSGEYDPSGHDRSRCPKPAQHRGVAQPKPVGNGSFWARPQLSRLGQRRAEPRPVG